MGVHEWILICVHEWIFHEGEVMGVQGWKVECRGGRRPVVIRASAFLDRSVRQAQHARLFSLVLFLRKPAKGVSPVKGLGFQHIHVRIAGMDSLCDATPWVRRNGSRAGTP
jgi:hypothetical protein